MLEIDAILKSFAAIFVIMDPFASIPVFLMITRGEKDSGKLHAAAVACAVAAGVLLIFMAAGPWLLETMGITTKSFLVAGGLLLLITSIQYFLGVEIGKHGQKRDIGAEVVLIGVPLLAGPGVMATSIILTATHGFWNVLAAGLAAVAISFFCLRLATPIQNMLGTQGIQIFSKIMAILLAAISVEFIRGGLA